MATSRQASFRTARWIGVLALVGCPPEYEVIDDFEVDPVEVLPCGFSPASGTKLSIYDCNPVFSGIDEAWATTTGDPVADGWGSVGFRTQFVFGHPVFQVWYAARRADAPTGWALGHAVSSNGIDWDPHPDNPVFAINRLWNADRASYVSVAYNEDAQEYALAYQGTNLAERSFGLGVMTSTNGVRWTEPADGLPTLDLTTSGYCWPLGLSWDPDRGYVGYLAVSKGFLQPICEAHEFTTDDFQEDTIDVEDRRALRVGPDAYDASGAASIATVKLGDTWYMFYVGFRTWESVEGYDNVIRTVDRTLNLATSTNGTRWAKHPDNPLPVSLNDPGIVGSVAAQAIGGRIHVWVADTYPDLGKSAVGYFLYEPAAPDHP